MRTALLIVPLALGAGVAASASGCLVPHLTAVEYHEVWVDEEPPIPHDDVMPPSPHPEAVWAPGYWYWTGTKHVWIAGRWRRPPTVGHVWVPHGWVILDGRYRYIPGRWAHPRRVPKYRYHRHRHHQHRKHHKTPIQKHTEKHRHPKTKAKRKPKPR